MKRISAGMFASVAGAFAAGFLSHLLYQRWSDPPVTEGRAHPVTFVPLSPTPQGKDAFPLVQAVELDRIRALAGSQARVEGRVYRVGHSAKSNTYFLNFGPSRASLTGVIFASALDRFEREKIDPGIYAGRKVEITGEIVDHSRYGLEIILEGPSQIRLLD